MPTNEENKTGNLFTNLDGTENAPGKLFSELLNSIDVSRDKVYIAPMVKCAPKTGAPTIQELDKCSKYVIPQIKTINPKIIVGLGQIPLRAIYNEDADILKDHGKWLEMDGVPFISIFHPAFIIKNNNKQVLLKTCQEDLRKIKQKLEELKK